MRCDQFAGIPPSAETFLLRYKKAATQCPTCGHAPPIRMEKIGTYPGMFGDEYPLFQRTVGLIIADEFHQRSEWSSGAVHFLGLRLEDGREFKWTEEEMNEWL